MARPDGRVQPGQRLDTAFSARAWNRAQDAADLVLKDRQSFLPGESVPRRDPDIILARAQVALQPGDWVFFEPNGPGPIDVDTSDATLFSRRVEMFSRPVAAAALLTPQLVNNYANQHIGMAVSAATQGALCHVQVSGSVFCFLRLRHRHHGYARFGNPAETATRGIFAQGVASIPMSGLCGPMRIVWFDDTNYAGVQSNASTTGAIVRAIVSL